MALLRMARARHHPVSTSKFGLGDIPGSSGIAAGRLEIAQKIGGGAIERSRFSRIDAARARS